jgi:uncharacterized RDD family membrane protein YckC
MNSATADTVPPRFFWRRFAAVVIDTLLFYVVAAAVSIVLVVALPWAPRYFIPSTTACEATAPDALVQRIEREWPLAPGQSRVSQICTTSFWGVPDSRSFVSILVDAGDNPTQRTISFEIDEAGNPVELEALGLGAGVLDELVPVLLFCLSSAGLIARFGTTPGKKLFALHVIQDSGEALPFAKAAKREALRMLPAILDAFSTPLMLLLIASFGSGDILRDLMEATTILGAPVLTIMLAGGLIFPLFAFVWWVLPLLRWRGQTIYDRLTECHVIHIPRAQTAQPAQTAA